MILISIVGISNASVNTYTEGHAHIGLVEDGSLKLHFHAPSATVNGVEDTELECEAEDVIIVVPDAAIMTRQSGSEWDMIGTDAGADTWILTASYQEGIPFLGFGAHDAEGIYIDNDINITLTGFSGPGEFSLFDTDAFGSPVFFMSSYDLGTNTFVFDLDDGDHAHLNFCFTEIGVYELTFTASADLIGGGIETSTATFTFEVVPEPVTIALLGAGAVRLRRRVRCC